MTFEELQAHREWMNLASVADAGDNRLRAVVQVGDKSYELFWDRYFAFLVRDEGAAAFRKEEEHTGLGVRSFRKSWLLDSLPELSNGLHEIPEIRGPVKHFGSFAKPFAPTALVNLKSGVILSVVAPPSKASEQPSPSESKSSLLTSASASVLRSGQ